MSSEVKKKRMHPLPLRIMHWINAATMIIMILSGWKIYDDEVIFGFLHFPDAITLGKWAQHGLQWHFFGMWLLVLNGIAYLAYGFATGRFRRLLLPIRPIEVIREVIAALKFRLAHADLTKYNAVQKILYVGVILIVCLQVVTGVAIWKPIQFSGLVDLFGGFQGARLVHFFGMASICAFFVVHVSLAFLVPKTILAMLTGGPRVTPDARASTAEPLETTH
jgi:thiosulfate reductase cytochrome b subunit